MIEIDIGKYGLELQGKVQLLEAAIKEGEYTSALTILSEIFLKADQMKTLLAAAINAK